MWFLFGEVFRFLLVLRICCVILLWHSLCLSYNYSVAFQYWNRYINHFDFVPAGIDTSRLTLRWAILHMVAYPEIQTKVQEEIDRVVGTFYACFETEAKFLL